MIHLLALQYFDLNSARGKIQLRPKKKKDVFQVTWNFISEKILDISFESST